MGGGIGMGLDSVELVMAIEEEFGLDIPDHDAEKMITVGDVYEWLRFRLSTADPRACLTQRVFYKLRRALIENYNVSRHTIAPDTRLTELLPLSVVEEGWPFLQMFIDLKTPPFKVANEFLGFRLSEQSLTMRELVQSLIKLNDEAFSPEHESERELWDRLVRVFVRQLNVRPEEVVLGASITRDLGVD
jgi:hypothetical protein